MFQLKVSQTIADTCVSYMFPNIATKIWIILSLLIKVLWTHSCRENYNLDNTNIDPGPVIQYDLTKTDTLGLSTHIYLIDIEWNNWYCADSILLIKLKTINFSV